MKLKLTKNNKTIIDFGDFDNEIDLKKTIFSFLDDKTTKMKYKVENYQTIHFIKDENGNKKKKIIDFGDYSYFLEVIY